MGSLLGGGSALVVESELLLGYYAQILLRTKFSFSPIKSVAATRPGLVIVKMGIFPRIPAPEFETFALHRHEWQGQHDGTIQYKIRLGDEKM